MSSIVAVVGGSTGLGRAIVEAIIADGKQKVYVLSRRADDLKAEEIGAEFVIVDYDNVESILGALEDKKIDTVISVLGSQGIEVAEKNLIEASEKSKVTKRYIPSDWSLRYNEKSKAQYPAYTHKKAVIELLKTTKLEHTTWYVGFFADYYVSPALKSYMTLWSSFIDFAHQIAVIPGSGNVPVAFSYTFDIAKFVSKSLTHPTWEPETVFYNDKLNLKQLVQAVEEVKNIKLNVTYDSLELLESGKVTELPSHPLYYQFVPKDVVQSIMAAIGIWIESGEYDLDGGHLIREDIPDVKLRTMRELLEDGENSTLP